MIPRIFITITLVLLGIQNVFALPSFSRQTGQSCDVCHLSYGELTLQGRKFKLMGYSEGNYVIPLSITGVVSDTKINNTFSSVDPSVTMPKNGSNIPEEASIYLAGKFYGKLGGFLKLTLNLSNTTPLLNSQGIQTGTKVGVILILMLQKFAMPTIFHGVGTIWCSVAR
jgi:hypothetical protein